MGLKEAYLEKTQEQLQLWQSKIDTLKAKAETLEAEQKVKYYEEIEDLRIKQQRVQTKLDEIRSASDSAWEEVKTGVELAWKELQVSVDRAVDKFR